MIVSAHEFEPTAPEHAFAARVAQATGATLLDVRGRSSTPPHKRELQDLGDTVAHEQIVRDIQAHFPEDLILSEENNPAQARQHAQWRAQAQRVWIIDPLDGTREFSEWDPHTGWHPDWAVHIALWDRTAAATFPSGLIAGAVCVPDQNTTWHTGAPPQPAPNAREVLEGHRPLRIAVSRSRPPALTHHGSTPVEFVPIGSAGVKAMAVLTGHVDAYLHAGGQFEWDSAAPMAVALAGGFYNSRLDGRPLRYNQPDPWLPDFCLAHPELASLIGRMFRLW